MPIDPVLLRGAELPGSEFAWDEDRVILYHLGLGMGGDPLDPGELVYLYEGDLQVLPSFATVAPFETMIGVGSLPGLEVNPVFILHGEHRLILHRPLPVRGQVSNQGRVVDVFDRGKGALLEIEVTSADAKGPLFTNRAGIYIRGEGGFGGERGPHFWPELPEAPPDAIGQSPTLPQQALIYRLSGDKNPLHADPAFAALAGYERPILHGLSTLGMVCRAAVDVLHPDQMTEFGGRFRGVVYPGEVVTISMWRRPQGLVLNAEVEDRQVFGPAYCRTE